MPEAAFRGRLQWVNPRRLQIESLQICQKHASLRILSSVDFGTNPYDIAFALVGPIAALLSLRFPHRWVFLLGVAAVLGWALEFGGDHWIDAQWAALAERMPTPSDDMMRQINTDGMSKSATLILGLPLAVVYAGAWFGMTYGVRRILKSRSSRS